MAVGLCFLDVIGGPCWPGWPGPLVFTASCGYEPEASKSTFPFFWPEGSCQVESTEQFFFLSGFSHGRSVDCQTHLQSVQWQWEFILISWNLTVFVNCRLVSTVGGIFFYFKIPKTCESSRLPRLSKKLKNSQILTVFVNCRLVSTVKTKKTGFFWRRLSTVDSPLQK